MKELAITAAFAPLVGAIIAGLGGRWLTRQGAHTAAIFSVLLSFLASCVIFWRVLHTQASNATLVLAALHLAVYAPRVVALLRQLGANDSRSSLPIAVRQRLTARAQED